MAHPDTDTDNETRPRLHCQEAGSTPSTDKLVEVARPRKNTQRLGEDSGTPRNRQGDAAKVALPGSRILEMRVGEKHLVTDREIETKNSNFRKG